jgi:hypothetical protein
MLELFEEFYKGKLDVRRLNYGIITLVPKVKKVARIQQFRPIYLLNCLYKWFTKCLTLRLEPVAQRIIHRAQAAFLGGRNIMSNILALYEFLHDTRKKGKTEIMLKLDFEKTYDKVHWGFLMKCMRLRGFGEKWCKWIESVIHNGTMAVKVNGVVGPYFQSYKGVK